MYVMIIRRRRFQEVAWRQRQRQLGGSSAINSDLSTVTLLSSDMYAKYI